MKRLILTVSSLLLFLVVAVVPVRKVLAEDLNYKIMAGFVYAVPNLVNEDNTKKKVCYYGYDQLTLALDDKYQDVVEITDLHKLATSGCRVLYVAKDKDRKLGGISKVTDPARIITIGLADDFVDNGGVMLLQMGRRSVEVTTNHSKVKALGIKFDPMLSGLIVN